MHSIATFVFILGRHQWLGNFPAPSCEQPAIFPSNLGFSVETGPCVKILVKWVFACSTFGGPIRILAKTSYCSKQTSNMVYGHGCVLLLRQCNMIEKGGERAFGLACPCSFVRLHANMRASFGVWERERRHREKMNISRTEKAGGQSGCERNVLQGQVPKCRKARTKKQRKHGRKPKKQQNVFSLGFREESSKTQQKRSIFFCQKPDTQNCVKLRAAICANFLAVAYPGSPVLKTLHLLLLIFLFAFSSQSFRKSKKHVCVFPFSWSNPVERIFWLCLFRFILLFLLFLPFLISQLSFKKQFSHIPFWNPSFFHLGLLVFLLLMSWYFCVLHCVSLFVGFPLFFLCLVFRFQIKTNHAVFHVILVFLWRVLLTICDTQQLCPAI